MATERSDIQALNKFGTWTVSMVVDPLKTDALPDQTFLNVIASSNPRYTGWPMWMDTRGFVDESARPNVIDDAWEALIVSTSSDRPNHVDFMRMDPRGKFLLIRVLQDDLSTKVEPLTVLDPILVVLRVAEVIAVGLAFVKALDWNLEHTKIGFSFRWTKLKGRELTTWAVPMTFLSAGRAAQDEVSTFVTVPADTPPGAISPFVQEATRGLFLLFAGYTMPTEAVDYWVQKLVERKL
jgi:hypothetical protein